MTVLVVVAAVAYLALMGAMWALQERFLFYPQPVPPRVALPEGWRVEAVRFAARDGVRLQGILALPPQGDRSAVIYFGGNAEEVTAGAGQAERLYGRRAVLLVNYRGYGASEGHPSERAIVEDAIALYDWLAARGDIDPARIAVHGRSLGTGVAVQVAAARPVRCVVLTSPFDSARGVAAEAYPWLPVAWLMRHPFDSAARAPRITAPLLVLVGADDTLIRPRRSEMLAARWGGPVQRAVFAHRGHGDVDQAPGYETAIHDFIQRSLGAT